jgi:hypothetical protein
LIRSSSISDDDKEEIQEGRSKVNKLALREPAPGLLERAKSRIDMVKLAITGTDVVIKAASYLDAVYEYFKRKYGG